LLLLLRFAILLGLLQLLLLLLWLLLCAYLLAGGLALAPEQLWHSSRRTLCQWQQLTAGLVGSVRYSALQDTLAERLANVSLQHAGMYAGCTAEQHMTCKACAEEGYTEEGN
jgi:hypothetical protein